MISVSAVVDRIGPTLLRTVALPERADCVSDVVIAEPGQRPQAAGGDLVLGVAVYDTDSAVDLVDTCGQLGASAVLLKPPFATEPRVAEAAAEAELAVVEVRRGAAWAQLVWLLSTVFAGSPVDEADGTEPATAGSTAPGPPAVPGSSDAARAAGGTGDLFRLADAVAAVIDAPVTIEDAHSRVLAYSARQDYIDPARISTIMGRRQPDDVLAKFRSRGAFRKLTRGSSAIFVPAQGDGTLPRLIVPIRMGGELLGSMWAVVPGEVSEERATAFADTGPVVALHLLRWRAVADAERQRSAELVRRLLHGDTDWRSAATELGLSAGPHRVVGIDVAAGSDPAEGRRLAMWERLTRGIGRRPAVTELAGVLYAVVPERADAADWSALREELVSDPGADNRDSPADPAGTPGRQRGGNAPDPSGTSDESNATREPDSTPLVAAGDAVPLSELSNSRAGADEVLALLRTGHLERRVAAYEDVWHLLVLHRMAGPAIDSGVGALGPLPQLRRHDEARGTRYVETLLAWLRHPGDPRAASRELRVHPNTFRYRMRRLRELVELDLDDTDVRSALLVQLLAEQWTRHSS